MKETTGQEQPRSRGRPPSDGPEFKVVGVNVNPAPDAQDRLRRLFTILAGVINDGPPSTGPDQPTHDDSGTEG